MTYTLAKSCLLNKIIIMNNRTSEVVGRLNKDDLKQELKYFINQSKDIPKTENKRLHLFYNEETGNLVFGKKVYTKKGLLNKKYLSNNFLKYSDENIIEANQILKNLSEED